MRLVEGKRVVHPAHGVLTITGVSMRTVNGSTREWAIARCLAPALTIEFPVENVGLIGLREPLGRSAAQSILDSMGALSQSEPENWSRRFKANEEKLASGRPERLAEVVQSLYVRKSKSELSAGERKLLLAASDLLAGELSVALGMTIDAALERIDQQLS